MPVWPGRPYPLGAQYDGQGTNFSLFTSAAEAVELCLFDDDGAEVRHQLPEASAYRWHGYVPGVGTGQRYGFRVHGPWDPSRGQVCNPAKLVLDPYAKAVCGDIDWDEACYGYRFGSPEERNDDDSAPFMPRSVVIDETFDWADDQAPRLELHELMIYEAHVKGLTASHPTMTPELRGTYAGLATPEAIEHLTLLGVSAIELLPVHQFVHDQHLIDKGLRNYWGYNSIGFFAPHGGYAAAGDGGGQVAEFKTMVKALHAAGIEVILDVVYNHTAEGNHLGPTLSFKGIDNAAYYRLVDGDPSYYMDYTGTGNSLNMRHPNVLQLLMDSLRYWVTDMHVDGFRFDLASTLARELHDVDRLSAFFDVIQQDPVVSQVKLIAEPWDVGDGGYQVGNFPPLWSEWNGRYRDTVRDYWRSEPGTVGEFAARLTGSSDLYEDDGRSPSASVNFITAHDGFTLADLVAYNDKYNEANGEGGQDGADDNRSWNCGAEGPTDDPTINDLRDRQHRNFLATLFLSQGVPMLVSGDEMGRTQGGNNNAYCQDNEISWLDWTQRNTNLDLLGFTRQLMDLRRAHPGLRRRGWFRGRPIGARGQADIVWLDPSGEEMSDEQWEQSFARSLAVFFNGEAIGYLDRCGRRIVDDSLLLCFNAHWETIGFTTPSPTFARRWQIVLDTATPLIPDGGRHVDAGDVIDVSDRSVVVLRRES
ncbi:MAG: glycogen debranching protein GlgX [Actinomycetota bacterium]|nr:glycogen debranching protein GlgX [Actinomycetota bacterium]